MLEKFTSALQLIYMTQFDIIGLWEKSDSQNTPEVQLATVENLWNLPTNR